MSEKLIAALSAPSFQQDSDWDAPDATYVAKPKALLDQAASELERLTKERNELREANKRLARLGRAVERERDEALAALSKEKDHA